VYPSARKEGEEKKHEWDVKKITSHNGDITGFLGNEVSATDGAEKVTIFTL
jgi:hypothetical protein